MLHQEGVVAAFPCADCPYPLDAANTDAWRLFCAAASRTKHKIDGREREYFDLDWHLITLLMERWDIDEQDEVLEKMIALKQGLNSL